MSQVVQVQSLVDSLKITVQALERVLALVLNNGDSKSDAASDALRNAVWKGYHEYKTNNGDLNHDELMATLSNIMGRVLTVIEATFPAGQQCEALKSLARQEVWGTRKRISAQPEEK